jgi:hypothetical protein
LETPSPDRLFVKVFAHQFHCGHENEARVLVSLGFSRFYFISGSTAFGHAYSPGSGKSHRKCHVPYSAILDEIIEY